MTHTMYEVEVPEVLNLHYRLTPLLHNSFGESKINEARGLC